jgi:glycosyltransferase involved in cell wall biosynthesis
MDTWSASTRQRAALHVPRLREHFAAVDLLPARDTVIRHPGGLGRARYFASHGGRYVARAAQIRRVIGRYDALLVQRGLYVLGPDAITTPVARFDGRVVLDLDDAVFELRAPLDHKGRAAQWLWGPQQTLALLRRADAVVVSSAALAEMLPVGAPDPIILPTVLDPSRYLPVRQRAEAPVVIGWAGTIEGLGYLDALADVFARLAADGVAELEVVSAEPWRGPARFFRWTPAAATTLFDRFAIGIMPLSETPYARAKAGFKLLEYMAAGLPVVASPVGVNAELVTQSEAGYLAGSPAEWEAALRELAASVELRRELGARGRSFVAAYADLDGQARALAALLAGA